MPARLRTAQASAPRPRTRASRQQHGPCRASIHPGSSPAGRVARRRGDANAGRGAMSTAASARPAVTAALVRNSISACAPVGLANAARNAQCWSSRRGCRRRACSGAVSPTQGGPGRPPTSRFRRPIRSARWRPRISSCWPRRPTCSAANDEYLDALRARPPRLPDGRRGLCPRALRLLGRGCSSRCRRDGRRQRMAGPRPAACSSATGATASSGATCCCRSCSSTRRAATWRPRPPRRRAPRRSASASATPTCSRSPRMRRATS